MNVFVKPNEPSPFPSGEGLEERLSAYDIIGKCYCEYHQSIKCYITCKLRNADVAEDLTQDVFLHLMECGQMVRMQTARNMLYTIARNLVIDYLRRYYCRCAQQHPIDATMLENKATTINVESLVSAADIARHEQARMQLLPPQRRKIYNMVRFEEKKIPEVAKELSLSVRTVENHLAIGRREMREYIRKCIGA